MFFLNCIKNNKTDKNDFQKTKNSEIQKLTSFFSKLKIMILIFKKEKKKVTSTGGMIDSTKTSENLKHRVSLLPSKLEKIIKIIDSSNYASFFQMIMQDR
jgi:mevalonate pyrophosphate decarboxylase